MAWITEVRHWHWLGVIIGLSGFGLLAVDDVLHGPVYLADTPVNDWVNGRAAAGWPTHSVGEAISLPGAYFVGGSAVVVCAVAWWLWGERKVALWAVLGSVAASLAVVVLKNLFERNRPPLAGAHAYSFPSGHTMGATAVLGILLLLGTQVHLDRYRVHGVAAKHTWRVVVLVWVVLTLAVGAARVLAQDHWMSDVLASWFLGVAILGLILRLAKIPRSAKAPPLADVVVGPDKPAEAAAAKAADKAEARADDQAQKAAEEPTALVRPGR